MLALLYHVPLGHKALLVADRLRDPSDGAMHGDMTYRIVRGALVFAGIFGVAAKLAKV